MKYSYDKQARLADEGVSIAREALRGRGVKVIAYVHIDRLRPLLKRYKRNGGVYRVLMRQRNSISISGFLREIGVFLLVRAIRGFPLPVLLQENLGARLRAESGPEA